MSRELEVTDTEPYVESAPISRAEFVHRHLRAEILRGDRVPGSMIVQDEVAAQLKVSVTPVREALRRLESTGLITYVAHRGATVAFLSDSAVTELYLLRSVVEGLAAKLAASRITSDQLDELQSIHAEMERQYSVSDVSGMSSGSRRFHGLIAEVGGPSYIARHLSQIWASSPIPTSESVWNDAERAEHYLEVHAQLIRALTFGDAARSEELMSEHIEDIVKFRTQNPS